MGIATHHMCTKHMNVDVQYAVLACITVRLSGKIEIRSLLCSFLCMYVSAEKKNSLEWAGMKVRKMSSGRQGVASHLGIRVMHREQRQWAEGGVWDCVVGGCADVTVPFEMEEVARIRRTETSDAFVERTQFVDRIWCEENWSQ